MLLQEPYRFADEVAKVEGHIFPEPPLIEGIDLGNPLLDEVGDPLRIEFGPYYLVLCPVNQGENHPRFCRLIAHHEILHTPLHQSELIGVVADGKAALNPYRTPITS